MGIEKACNSMLTQPGLKPGERAVLVGILDGIDSGESIGNSLKRSRVPLSQLEIEIVSSSERGGLLEKGLGHLSDHFRRVHQTRGKILKGLSYPLLVGHIAIPLAIFAITMLGHAMPDADPDGGWDTALNAASWVARGYVLVVVLVLFFIWLHKKAKKSAAADRFLNRIPLVGRARKSLALARFCEVFHIQMLAGMRMSEALEGAGRASLSGSIEKASLAGAEVVKQGHELSGPIFGHPDAFPNDFARGIAAAEESGEMDREIDNWARFYNDDAGEAMDQLAEWTPKVFYWLVVFFVAGILIRVGLAYRDLIDGWLNLEV